MALPLGPRENAEKDENGRCRAGKDVVYQRHGILFSDHRGKNFHLRSQLAQTQPLVLSACNVSPILSAALLEAIGKEVSSFNGAVAFPSRISLKARVDQWVPLG